MADYHVNLFYSDEDEGYIADIPDLVHCSAFDESPEEAWINSAQSSNKPIPPPTYRPAIYQVA